MMSGRCHQISHAFVTLFVPFIPRVIYSRGDYLRQGEENTCFCLLPFIQFVRVVSVIRNTEWIERKGLFLVKV